MLMKCGSGSSPLRLPSHTPERQTKKYIRPASGKTTPLFPGHYKDTGYKSFWSIQEGLYLAPPALRLLHLGTNCFSYLDKAAVSSLKPNIRLLDRRNLRLMATQTTHTVYTCRLAESGLVLPATHTLPALGPTGNMANYLSLYLPTGLVPLGFFAAACYARLWPHRILTQQTSSLSAEQTLGKCMAFPVTQDVAFIVLLLLLLPPRPKRAIWSRNASECRARTTLRLATLCPAPHRNAPAHDAAVKPRHAHAPADLAKSTPDAAQHHRAAALASLELRSSCAARGSAD